MMFMKSIKSVGPLLLIYVLMHVTFSIMAVQLLQGRLFYCNDSTKLTRDQCRYYSLDSVKRNIHFVPEGVNISMILFKRAIYSLHREEWEVRGPR